MHGDHLAAEHYGNPVAVSLDSDDLERRGTGHAVAVGVEAHHLVLVSLGGLDDIRIEVLFG